MVSARSGQPGINADEYGNYSFMVPSTPEQDKVTNFLTILWIKKFTQ